MATKTSLQNVKPSLKRGYTSDFLLVMVMRFFIASALWWLHVATNFYKVRDFVAKNSTH